MKGVFLIFSMLALLTSCFRIPTQVEEGQSISLERFAKMPAVAKECSGLLVQDDGFLVLNDGGNGSYLHLISGNGLDSVKSIFISGVENNDWEAITETDEEIIIGNFGNNLGKRTDLAIHHIDKEDYSLIKSINFVYPNQKRFDDPKHNFDCEAMVLMDGQYYLFTKNRANKKSNIYSSKIGEGNFQFIDSIELEGMVTDAVYHEKSESILLLCYDVGLGGFKNSLAIVKKQSDGGFKTTGVFNIGPAEQFEAIAHLKDNRFIIGSELGILGNGRHLYLVRIQGL